MTGRARTKRTWRIARRSLEGFLITRCMHMDSEHERRPCASGLKAKPPPCNCLERTRRGHSAGLTATGGVASPAKRIHTGLNAAARQTGLLGRLVFTRRMSMVSLSRAQPQARNTFGLTTCRWQMADGIHQRRTVGNDCPRQSCSERLAMVERDYIGSWPSWICPSSSLVTCLPSSFPSEHPPDISELLFSITTLSS